jgi:hypothetical protein
MKNILTDGLCGTREPQPPTADLKALQVALKEDRFSAIGSKRLKHTEARCKGRIVDIYPHNITL